MSTRLRTWVQGGLVASLCAGALALGIVRSGRVAEACGGFFRSSPAAPKPSLAHEQVLIVFDPSTDTEHFIRQVAFREAKEPFGFVVPTPSRPAVFKVGKSPFPALRERFAFEQQPPSHGATGVGHGLGSGSGGSGGVTVLEVSKVGSFTAFVLAANDATALSQWLAEHKLSSTPEADAWLAHYVRMKFYYVAMRYDPPQPAAAPRATATAAAASARPSAKVSAETIRISFTTPLPYYPYFEPKAPAGTTGSDRLLELWMVTPQAMSPIAMRTQAAPEWVRPLRPGRLYPAAQADVRSALEDEIEQLLPAGELVAQTFQDQKWSRAGFGDMLFVTQERSALSSEDRDKLRPFVGLFDPELLPPSVKP